MEFEEFITRGLKSGFASDAKPAKITRGVFPMKQVHFEEDGNEYHDEWTKGRLGGGQELVHTQGKDYTRLYAGGIISDEELAKLGIKEDDVKDYLTGEIQENGEKTRLFSDCEPEPKGPWEYSYKIMDNAQELELTQAKECIYYKGTLVFVHFFLLSPVQ